MHLRGFKGSLQDDKKSRCLVNESLPCHIGGSEKTVLLMSDEGGTEMTKFMSLVLK